MGCDAKVGQALQKALAVKLTPMGAINGLGGGGKLIDEEERDKGSYSRELERDRLGPLSS